MLLLQLLRSGRGGCCYTDVLLLVVTTQTKWKLSRRPGSVPVGLMQRRDCERGA